jgi:hypothetical protein
MYRTLIPPHEPKQPEPVHPPMIYIEKRLKWEYKQIVRNLKKENPPDETELNQLGEEGWEMSGVAQQPPLAYFYFKRLIEK